MEKIENCSGYRHAQRSPGHSTVIQSLEILGPTIEYTNHFTVEVKFMQGDGDGYKTEVVAFAQTDEEKLIAFLNFLVACSNKYRRGKGGYDSYGAVPGYLYWCFAEEVEDGLWSGYEPDDQPSRTCPVLLELTEKFGPWEDEPALIDWPKHEGEYWYSFDEATVFWHNENGMKHVVRMKT